MKHFKRERKIKINIGILDLMIISYKLTIHMSVTYLEYTQIPCSLYFQYFQNYLSCQNLLFNRSGFVVSGGDLLNQINNGRFILSNLLNGTKSPLTQLGIAFNWVTRYLAVCGTQQVYCFFYNRGQKFRTCTAVYYQASPVFEEVKTSFLIAFMVNVCEC